jgi:hypothetical protein
MTVMTFDGRTFEVDDEIASIVHALNAAGISTVASCSGHGMRPGRISLVDGRELFVLPSYEIGQWFETQFPRDINGQTATERAAVPPNASQQIERLQRAITGAMDLLSNGDTEGGARVLRECFWGTDAPCQDCKGERFVRFGNMRVECLKCNDPDSTAVTKSPSLSDHCPCGAISPAPGYACDRCSREAVETPACRHGIKADEWCAECSWRSDEPSESEPGDL